MNKEYFKDGPTTYQQRVEMVDFAESCLLKYFETFGEQLAGDLLPNATVGQMVATGFHRNTLTNTEGGTDQEEFRVKATVDRVNTPG